MINSCLRWIKTFPYSPEVTNIYSVCVSTAQAWNREIWNGSQLAGPWTHPLLPGHSLTVQHLPAEWATMSSQMPSLPSQQGKKELLKSGMEKQRTKGREEKELCFINSQCSFQAESSSEGAGWSSLPALQQLWLETFFTPFDLLTSEDLCVHSQLQSHLAFKE